MALITDVSKSEIVHLDMGNDTKITLRIIKKSGKKVRICIDAPKTVSISKKEIQLNK